MDLQAVVSQFEVGEFVCSEEIRAGIINGTFGVTCRSLRDSSETERYVFQRINTYVFKHPRELMQNIEAVTTHIQKRILRSSDSYDRQVLDFVRANDGNLFLDHPDYGFWRAYHFVEGTCSYNTIQNPRQFYELGRTFGRFQRQLSDFPAQTLHETIPNFHNTVDRLRLLDEAIERNAVGRRDAVQEEIAFIRDRRDEAGAIVRALENGEIPWRVTHNDTKLNNALFDTETDKAICVIDLDTVMPGSTLYDYGDAIRSGANNAAEDEPDFSKVSLNMELFEQFTQGFLEGTHGFLTQPEVDLLALSAKILTLELAMRFLTDYLDGDLYFKTCYPEHNLVRTRNQLQLVRDMEEKMPQMEALVQKHQPK